jgi:hypothetical protein
MDPGLAFLTNQVKPVGKPRGNSHFGFRGLAILASALRCRMNAAFRTRPERRIYAAGPQNENRCKPRGLALGPYAKPG